MCHVHYFESSDAWERKHVIIRGNLMLLRLMGAIDKIL